jgi:DNA-binding SARP family transcriptional activator
VEFRILGPLEARENGVVLALGGAKQRALLAVLLLEANRVIPTERLVDALWDEPPAGAVKAVQVYVSRLRKSLGTAVLRRRASGYLLEVEPEQLDLERFRRLLEEARRDSTRALHALEDALSLWRGPPLAEFANEPFARIERPRLEELRLEALEEHVDVSLAAGRQAAVVGELESLVEAHPLRERLRGQLMLALYRCGRQAEALAAYRDARHTLVDELGIEPGRQLQELEQAILRQDPSLEASPAPARVETVEPATRPTVEHSTLAPVHEERKLISVLVVDVLGAARFDFADPEDVRVALEPFHAAGRREIERHGGTVEKFIGDTTIAVFGAPAAHEDDPERAVRAALAIREWVTEEGGDVQVRMAVNTGVALVSLDSRPSEGEPIAAGDVVNSAQHMQAAAPLNGILVGEQTHRATRDAIEYRELASVEAKGKVEPIPVWEVVDARSRLGVDLVREPRTALVGRRRELELLTSALARVREERSPQLVTIVGVPGIGKSRLVFELFKLVDEDRELIKWRQGRCLSYGEGVSFWALGEAIKAQAGILESDSPEQAQEKLLRTVSEVMRDTPDAAWVEQHLRPLVGAGAEPGSPERSGEAFAAWRRFLEGLADERPLVLVLEDLHWADDGLLDFVDELADRVRDAALLVLCTTRPELLERRPGWGGGKTNALTISLAPLSEAETEQLVAAVLDEHPLEADAHAALLARAGGNPLYAEQFARMLAEVGQLEELPESVHGIIATRLDGLSPQEKALVRDAAVAGKAFSVGALVAIGNGSPGEAEDVLVGLERKEFVRRARRSTVAGEAEYAFRHVLLRDVAYEQIPRAARGDKHRRAADWIESLGRPDDHAEMLAHHYLSALEYVRAAGDEEGELAERTRLALRAAGDRALALASYASAARLYGSALELWPEDDPDRVWLLVRAGRAKHAADGTGIELLEAAFEDLQALGDIDGAAEVAVELARCFWLRGDRDTAYSYVDRALELGRGSSDSKAKTHALVHRAVYHMLASEHSEAIRLAREALPLTEALGLDDLQARALDVLGGSRAMSGDVGGLDDSRRAIALARESNAFRQLIPAEVNLLESQVSLGQLGAAFETSRIFLRDVDSYGSASERTWARSIETYQAALYGRWDEAAHILDELVAATEKTGAHYLEPTWYALRASMEVARGDLEAASADSEKALEDARMTKDPQILAPALTVRSIVLLALGRREEASRLASEVIARGSVPLAALLHLFPTVTPIEFSWLLGDLGRQAELLTALEHAPSTPWFEAARAIAKDDFKLAVECVASLGAPSVEAYTRLRAAEELARSGDAEASEVLAPAVDFFRSVGAKRWLERAEALPSHSA